MARGPAGRHRARGGGWGVPRPKSERGHKEARLLPRPLTLRMLINQAANRWLGRGAPLRQSGGHGSGVRLPGDHGAPSESEGVGGGEPGLLPAPGLQQAPVSPSTPPPSCPLFSPPRHPPTAPLNLRVPPPRSLQKGDSIFVVITGG